MNDEFTVKLKEVNKGDLHEISLRSSNAKSREVFIFETGDLSTLFGENKAEQVREGFLKNEIKVKQITNASTLPKFTANDEFVNKVMIFRYIPENIFNIKDEILIFDDTVAIYNEKKLLVIEDKNFANNHKQFFANIWEQGQSPNLGFEYKPSHSYYKNLNYNIDGLQIIVWPDIDAVKSFKGFSYEQLGVYIKGTIAADEYYADATYIVAFIWALGGDKMIDIWKFIENSVDDRSGPLGDVRVYREGKLSNESGIASGSTLIVLGFEERLRRQSKGLDSYINGPGPQLPLEIMNGRSFFDENK